MFALPALATALVVAAAPTLTLERIFSDPPLEGRAPAALQLSPGGAWVSFLKGSEADSDVLDLWAARLPDGKPALLVATDDLLGGKAQKLTEQERMALERKRITKRGITSYLWCGDDAKALLFPLSGDLYFVQLGVAAGDKPKVTRLTTDEDAPELNPVCSKSGKKVAFVKAGNVVVMDTATKVTKQITTGAGKTRSFGLPEFIAEEEMDRHEGMWWAPDEKSLLVLEVDESPVGVKTRAQIFADHTEMFEQRYPAAGENNAIVRPWLIALDGNKTKLRGRHKDGLVVTGEKDEWTLGDYVARAGFLANGKPWIAWQSRSQKELAIFEAGPRPSERDIVQEHDDAWVELSDDFVPLKDGKRALWTTEQSGRRQIVVVDLTACASPACATKQLTDEPEPVSAIEAVDEDKGLVFYTAWRDRGRELRAFSVPLGGGTPTLITPEPGWHAVRFDDAGRFFVDRASNSDTPARTSVKDATGKTVLVVDENPATELLAFERSAPQWLDITAADGKTLLNGVLYPPTHVEKGKQYPVIVNTYGGPGAQLVTRAWNRGVPVHTFWNEQGYGVFVVDNRGMAGRDRSFTRAHDHAFGDVEVKDLFAAVEQLKKVPWVDGKRLGYFGWSYGGFLAARAILDDNTPFAAAVAVAPVTDWTLYDTHYTERYLGMPGSAAKPSAAYESANIVRRAALLKKPFLILHGTADDNVLFEHSLRLMEALEKEGRMFQTVIYPGKAHGISGKPSQLHVYKTITAFFDDKLR